MLLRALSKLGICSRRQAKRVIHAGRVAVNGKMITRQTYWVNLARDVVALDGEVAQPGRKPVYLMLNKPSGYMTTRRDNLQRPTVFDLLASSSVGNSFAETDFPLKSGWVFPVGRLDYNSEGLLLFTNDGPLGEALANPASHVAKVYRVLVDSLPPPEELRRLEKGIRVLDYMTLPAQIEIEGQSPRELIPPSDGDWATGHLPQTGCWLRVTICEGKNRQVRRMLAAAGSEVRRLIRIRFGPLELGDLPVGRWRELNDREVQALRRAGGYAPGHEKVKSLQKSNKNSNGLFLCKNSAV